MSGEKHKNPFVNSMYDEILNNYNKSKAAAFTLQDYILEPATDVKDFLNHLQIWTSEYYRLTFQCHEKKAEKDPKISLEDLKSQINPCNSQVKFFIKKRPEVTTDDPQNYAYHKENNIYCSLLSSMLIFCKEPWCPLSYLCRSDLLVLQDLDDLRYSNLCGKETFNRLEMFQVLKSLATMHACSLVYEYNNNCLINETFSYCLEEFLIAENIPWFKAGINALINVAKKHPNYTESSHKQFIEKDLAKHLNTICSMVKSSNIYRNVLCHGCPWIGNVFLNTQNTDAAAILIDFQNCRYCPPAIDVVLSMYMNISKDDKANHENTFLKYYYDNLLKCLDHNYLCTESIGISEEQFLQSYKEFQLFGLVFRALSDTVLKVSTEYINDQYKYEDRSLGVLDYMEKNEEFRSVMLDNVKDIMDYIMLNNLKK